MKQLSHKQARSLLHSGDSINAKARERLEQHLKECETCRSYAGMTAELSQKLEYAWAEPTLDAATKRQIYNQIKNGIEKRAHFRGLFNSLQAIAWIGISIAFMVGLLYAFERIIPGIEPSTLKIIRTVDMLAEETPEAGLSMIYEGDLDCNGEPEKLIVNRQLLPYDPEKIPRVTNIYLERAGGTEGQPVWEYSTDQYGSGFFLEPQILDFSECERLVAIPVITPNQQVGELLIFHWEDGQMNNVLKTKGWPSGYASQYLESPSGRCQIKVFSYNWNGETFKLVGATEKMVGCKVGGK